MQKVTKKLLYMQLFVSPRTVLRTVRTFLHTGDVKPCRIGRPTGSTTLFPHEEYVLIDCLPRMPQIQLHEIEILSPTPRALPFVWQRFVVK